MVNFEGMQGVVAFTHHYVTLRREKSFSYGSIIVNMVTDLGVVGIRKEGNILCMSEKIQKLADVSKRNLVTR